ncbi:acyl-CoA thioesterase [Risungbinella massiliensis]|uniref:acyl-CoA thioesterase n=1 Tax=Risungbinella massiliensis TaxID=1329796 RepID=UPI0005CC152E|nr:acyl-CoA thioesterase [Risungbinella massiliensis]
MNHFQPKTIQHSKTIKTEMVKPPDTNQHDTLFGGRVMALIDEAAAICSTRHCGFPTVTASLDYIHFLNPSYVGDILTLEAYVVWTGKTSMEVKVSVHSEDKITGEKKLTTRSMLTMVAIDEHGRPAEVPPVLPETEEEVEWQKLAYELRKERKAQKGRFL